PSIRRHKTLAVALALDRNCPGGLRRLSLYQLAFRRRRACIFSHQKTIQLHVAKLAMDGHQSRHRRSSSGSWAGRNGRGAGVVLHRAWISLCDRQLDQTVSTLRDVDNDEMAGRDKPDIR